MDKYNEILKLLEKEYGWNLFDSLTDTGKKLVADTLKAEKQVNKLPIHGVIDIPEWLPHLALDYAETLMKEGKNFKAVKHIHPFAKGKVVKPINWCLDFLKRRCR